MRSPIFQHIGSRGYFWFLLFQLFTTDDHDGTNPVPGTHPLKNMIIGGEGPYSRLLTTRSPFARAESPHVPAGLSSGEETQADLFRRHLPADV